MAADPVDFEVALGGQPRLEGEDGPDQGLDPESSPPPIEEVAAPAAVPGWTPQEAAQVVGGGIANLTIVLYAMRWKAAPPAELAPLIAGNPAQEFSLMGAGLAPVLDLVAPKGSPAAIGVSLTAGVGEVVTAVARRSQVLQIPPPKKQRPAAPAPAPAPGGPIQPPAPAPAPPAADPAGGSRFRFGGDQLRVLEDAPLAGVGIE